VLGERAGGGEGPVGALGFRTADGWVHATRVLSSRRVRSGIEATVATGDPGRRLAVRVTPDGEGVIAVRMRVVGAGGPAIEALGGAFGALAGERYLGFGERSNAVDQRGKVVESYVSDGPYQAKDRPLVASVIPPAGLRPRDDATYFPIPWLLSTKGYAVLIDNAQASYYRLATDVAGAWSLEVADAPRELRFRVFAGPRPADALRRLTERTGRQPRPAAPWLLGPWYQPGGSTSEQAAQLRALRAADAPVSAAQTYLHYLPCGDQQGRREQERARTRALHATGVAVTTYVNPMICTGYAPRYGQAVRAGALTPDAAGRPVVYRYSTRTGFDVSQFDFSAPAGRSLYARLLREPVQDGHDGWMEDFGEYTPLDARPFDGAQRTAAHNLYPRLYHCAAFAAAARAPRPIVRFQRSGWTGAARCAQVVWGGDPTTTFGFDGLASALRQGLTMGLSGVSLWGSDIGGFFSLLGDQLSGELLERWVQLGAVSGVMRTERDGIAVPAKPRPQVDDPGQLANWRRWTRLRTQLYPYLAAADAQYARTGLPIMRHLALAYPTDPRAVRRDDEFLFGPDLLAAPVLAAGRRSRNVYLPRGRWVDLWRSAGVRARGGALALRRARVLSGGRAVRLPAPLDELPLLVRAGAVLPLLTPDVDTLAGYGGGRGVVRLRDRADRLDLLAFPRGRARVRLARGEVLEASEHRSGWRVDVLARRTRTYRLQASLATLRRPLRPCAVTVDGRALRRSRWSYDPAGRTLRVTFRLRSRGRLEVLRRCR
jgi:alpha-D-xyloside xylohydrolase